MAGPSCCYFVLCFHIGKLFNLASTPNHKLQICSTSSSWLYVEIILSIKCYSQQLVFSSGISFYLILQTEKVTVHLINIVNYISTTTVFKIAKSMAIMFEHIHLLHCEILMELVSSLQSNIFGSGTIAYKTNRSLQCDLSISGKKISLIIPIQTNISDVSSLIVREDSSFVLLVYHYGILVVKTVSIIMHAVRTQKQQETINLPFLICCCLTFREFNIMIPGIVSCCCFNPQSKKHLHVLDNSANLYTYNIECNENPLVLKKRLFQQKVSRTNPFFMDILVDYNLKSSIIIGLQNGKLYSSKSVDNNQLCEIDSELEFSLCELGMTVPRMTVIRKLEEYKSMILYCMISPCKVTFLLYHVYDKQMYVLEVHSFDHELYTMIDRVERVVIVGEDTLSYQWIFDVINGKEVWERYNEKDSQDSEALALLLSRREMQKARELTEAIKETFQNTKSLETFMDKSMIENTLATLNT